MARLQKFLVLPFLALISACVTNDELAPSRTAWATLSGEAPLIIAHRGASGYLPEHTLEAYALAIEQGADVIEPDLVFTKDSVLVARHDRYLSTTTNVAELPVFADRRRVNPDTNDDPRDDWWVEDFTLAELKTLRARQPFEGRSKEFDDQYLIPTFDEVLALVERKAKEAGRPVGVYPETKHPGFFASIGYDFERPLLTALQGFNAGPVFIQSFEPEILKRLKGKTTAKLVQLVYEETPGAGPNIPLEDIAKYADGVGAEKSLLLGANSLISEFELTAHDLGLFDHYWTFRDDVLNERFVEIVTATKPKKLISCKLWTAEPLHCDDGNYEPIADDEIRSPDFEIEFALGIGVDGVFTDFPDTAVRVRNNMYGE